MAKCCVIRPDAVTREKVAELEKLMEKNYGKDFQQDGFIAQLFNMYRCEVQQAVINYLDVLRESGELDALLQNLQQVTKPYYTGIETKKKRDTVTGTDYYVTKIPKVDNYGEPLRLQLGIANDAYNGAGLESTVEFSHRKHATIAVNAGVFDVATGAPIGSLIQNGRIVASGSPADPKYQYLAIMANGSLRVYPRSTSPGAMLNDGATDAVCIFASLLENGVIVEQTDIRQEPRQSIGVSANGNIVIVTCDGRKPGEDAGMSYGDMARIHAQEGSYNAWSLDGGGSASTVLRGVKQNDDIDQFDTDRKVNTFLYVAKPVEVEQINTPGNDLGNVKQMLIAALMDKVDFYSGYIRLRGRENYFAPGIEMYVNAEEKRRSKVGMTIDKNNARNSYFYISFRGEDTEVSNMFRIYPHGVYMQPYHGTSSERPNAPVGMMFFDETINKPIWKGNDGWIDATGAAV